MTTDELLISADRETYSASCILTQCGERNFISEAKAREVLAHLTRAHAAMQGIVSYFSKESNSAILSPISTHEPKNP